MAGINRTADQFVVTGGTVAISNDGNGRPRIVTLSGASTDLWAVDDVNLGGIRTLVGRGSSLIAGAGATEYRAEIQGVNASKQLVLETDWPGGLQSGLPYRINCQRVDLSVIAGLYQAAMLAGTDVNPFKGDLFQDDGTTRYRLDVTASALNIYIGPTKTGTSETANTLALSIDKATGIVTGSISAASLTVGTIPDARLPARLQDSTVITDWNNAIQPGKYRSQTGALGVLNTPDGGAGAKYWIGSVNKYSDNWVVQDLINYEGTSTTLGDRWRRFRQSGIWGSWFRVIDAQWELDVRFPRMPQTTNSAGVGYYIEINPGSGASFTLPAGGTWMVWDILMINSGGFSGCYSRVYAGGTVIGGFAGFTWFGFAWRVA